MSERIRVSYDDAQYKSTYRPTLLTYLLGDCRHIDAVRLRVGQRTLK